ncbi:MAG: acyltransferase, partial [Pedobacter sp.]
KVIRCQKIFIFFSNNITNQSASTFPAFFKIMAYFPGVAMFFVMSGFLISASLERNKELKTYFKNRALRIFPALWACLILTTISIYLFANISFFNKEFIPWFFSQLVGFIYTPQFLNRFGFGSYNGSLWTIPLELQFYIVLPIIYFLTSRISKNETYKTMVIIAIFLVFLALTFIIKSEANYASSGETLFQKIIRYTFIPNIYLFLFGVVMQRLKIFQSNYIYGKGLLWITAYLAFVYLIPSNTIAEMVKLLFLGIITISLAYSAPTLSKKLLRGNDISYGMYIYHGLVLGFVAHFKLFGNINYVLLIFLTTTLLAVLSWLFVEKPFMRKKKKSIHKIIDHQLSTSIAS